MCNLEALKKFRGWINFRLISEGFLIYKEEQLRKEQLRYVNREE